MKDKKPHCPYCSNHCPLDKPKCRKGKELAAALAAGKVTQGQKAPRTKQDFFIPEEIAALLDKASEQTRQQKDNLRQILEMLEEKGTISITKLQKELDLKKKDIEKELRHLKKKKLVHFYKEGKENLLVLSKEGHKKATKILKSTGQKAEIHWDALTREEKEVLLVLLQKLNGVKVLTSDEEEKRTPEVKEKVKNEIREDIQEILEEATAYEEDE